jgi:hypothetical protein
MKRLALVLTATVLVLAGCAPSVGDGGNVNVNPTDFGDDVTIEQMSGDEVSEYIASGSAIDEFVPVLEGNVVTFFTSGSSSCKNEPLGAKVSEQYTMVLFRIYPPDTACTEDFGIYGWRLTFNETPPFVGTEFVRCEIDTCYPNSGNNFPW